MANTHILKEYITRIDSLNDQLWYFLFTSEELNRQLSNFSDKAKENYTIDLFKNNHMANRIHVKANELAKFQRDNKNQTFGAYFSTSYEISSNYIKDIFDTIKSFNSLRQYSWKRNTDPETNLETLLNREALPPITNEILKTYTYLRLRRNHFTHLSANPSANFSSLINNEGNSLNTFWAARNTASSIDFTSHNISTFTQTETIDYFNLLRICINEIDSHIAGLLNINSVIENIVKRVYNTQTTRINHLVLLQRNKKIRKIIQMELDRVVTDQQITPFTTSIGIR